MLNSNHLAVSNMVIDGDTRQQRWESAPLMSVQELTAGGPILVVAPHPDDETIGCGGLMRLAIKAGIVVHVATLTDGSQSHPHSNSHPPALLATIRHGELHAALRVLGVAENHVHVFKRIDGTLSRTDRELVASLAALIVRERIQAVFCAWGGDSHPDHRATHDICVQSIGPHPTVALWAYPVWGKLHDSDHVSEYADEPAVRLHVGDHIEAKMAAMSCHASQLGGLIHDDAEGFSISPQQLDSLISETEIFIRL